MTDARNAASLMEEMTLSQIWCASRRSQKSRVNSRLRLLVFVILAVYSLLPWSTADALVDITRTSVSTGFSALLSLLGFLLAGFLVFISVARRDLWVAMNERDDPESGYTLLKVNLFAFIAPLIELFAFSVSLLCASLLSARGGALAVLVHGYDSGALRLWVARLGFVIVGCAIGWSLVTLKSVIRNTYHLVATSLRWEIEVSNDD